MISMLQRMAAFASLGLVLAGSGPAWNTLEFGCIWALVFVIDYLAGVDGREQGMVLTLELYADLSEHERAELVRVVKSVQAAHNDDTNS